MIMMEIMKRVQYMIEKDYKQVYDLLNINYHNNYINKYKPTFSLYNNKLITNMYEKIFAKYSQMTLYVNTDYIRLERYIRLENMDIVSIQYIFYIDIPDYVGVYLKIYNTFDEMFDDTDKAYTDISLYDLKLDRYIGDRYFSDFFKRYAFDTNDRNVFNRSQIKIIEPHIHYRDEIMNDIHQWKFYIDYLNTFVEMPKPNNDMWSYKIG